MNGQEKLSEKHVNSQKYAEGKNPEKSVKERKRIKIPKWIWIPAVVIAGIMLLPIIITAVFIIIMLVLPESEPTEQQVIEYVNENYQKIESLSEEVLSEYPDAHYKTIRGYDIDDRYHDDDRFDDMFTRIYISEDESGHRMVQFTYKATGLSVSGSEYYLIYYSGDVPLYDFYGDGYERVQTGENEWEWGDVYNGRSLKKVLEKFYLSREWT